MTTYVYVSLSDAADEYHFVPGDHIGGPDCVISGNGGDDLLYGAWGNDYLYGGAGFDTLVGSDGNDHLYGEADGDVLDGGLGGDVLDGGDSFDIANYQASEAAVTVNLLSGVALGGYADGDTLASIEGIWGSAFSDYLAGNDVKNILEGFGGDDTLLGNRGNDVLQGGLGSDSLDGGLGRDLLFGGQGRDGFYFNSVRDTPAGPSRDIIEDFRRTEHDFIDLARIDADVTKAGNQAFHFIGADSFAHFHALHPHVFGMVRVVTGRVQANVNGNLAPDFEIAVHGNMPHLADFVL